MSTSLADTPPARAITINVTEEALIVQLVDGRSLSVPLAWYPRLARATASERSSWRLIGRGEGIHWPALDEDISIDGLLAGRASGESSTSLAQWTHSRQQG